MSAEKCSSSKGEKGSYCKRKNIIHRSIFPLLLVLPMLHAVQMVMLFIKEIRRYGSGTVQDTVQESDPRSNSTLVVVMGSLRGGEQAWSTLAANVLDPSAADLALCIGEFSDNDTSIVNSSLYKRAKYVWTFKEYEDWGDAIDLLGVTDWRELLPLGQVFGGVKGIGSSGAVQGMVRWFLSNHLKQLNLPEKYDRFLITRADHYYQCMHNVSDFQVGNKMLWIPPGQDWGGKTDRHVIVGSEDVLDAIDVFPAFFSTPRVLYRLWQKRKTMKQDLNGMNIEQLLDGVWESKNMTVNYLERVMFTCAVEGDTTRWKQASEPVPGVPGLFKKYTGEYDTVQRNCPPIHANST